MMDRANEWWDVDWEAAWLRRAWGWPDGAPPGAGAQQVEQVAPAVANDVAPPEDGPDDDDELDIAGWPALVAPFYD